MGRSIAVGVPRAYVDGKCYVSNDHCTVRYRGLILVLFSAKVSTRRTCTARLFNQIACFAAVWKARCRVAPRSHEQHPHNTYTYKHLILRNPPIKRGRGFLNLVGNPS